MEWAPIQISITWCSVSKIVDNLLEGIPGTFPVVDDITVQGTTELEHDTDILEICDCAK